MSQTTSIQGEYNNGFISPETFLNARDVRKRIFDKYNERSLLDLMWHSGFKTVTANTRFNHYEDDYLFSYVQQAGAATGTSGAGNPVTITAKVISPAEAEGPGSWAVSGYTKSPFKKWDLVRIGNINGWITSVDKDTAGAHTFTALPTDSNDNIVAAAAADLYISVFSSAKSDGTGQPESMVRKPILYYNVTQIFAHNYTTNGSEAANRSEVTVDGKPYFYLKGATDASLMHMLKQEFAYVMGNRSDGLVDADNDNEPVNTTGGIDWYIKTFGSNLTHTPGSYDYDNLETMEKNLSGNRAAKHVLVYNGLNVNIEMDDAVKGKLDAGGSSAVDWSKFGDGDGAKRAVDWGIDGFRFSNRNYYKKEMECLNYKAVTGHASATWSENTYAIPIGTLKNPKMNKENPQEYFDTMGMRYKETDRENRYIESWTRDKKITNLDKLEFNHLSETGFHMIGASQAVASRP